MVFHPGVGVEFRWDSNIFYESRNPTNAFMMRLTPTIEFATRPQLRDQQRHAIDFRLHAGLDYREYLTANNQITDHRQFGVQAGMLLSLFRGRAFSLDILDNFQRSSQLPYSQTPYNIDRDTNEVGVRIGMRPGGGRLEINTGYIFGLDYFETAAFQEFNVYTHKMNARIAWKVFPKTAVWIEGNGQFYVYPNRGPAAHPNGYPLRVTAGLTGLITAKLNLNVWAGYANGFYTSGPSPNTGVGGLDLGWRPLPLTSLAVGYKHEFANSLLGSYYDSDMAYLTLMQSIWRATFSGRVSYQNLRYQGIMPSSSVTDLAGNPITQRTDDMVTFNFLADLQLKTWLRTSIGYDLAYNYTPTRLNSGATGLLPANYLKHEVFLRLSIVY